MGYGQNLVSSAGIRDNRKRVLLGGTNEVQKVHAPLDQLVSSISSEITWPVVSVGSRRKFRCTYRRRNLQRTGPSAHRWRLQSGSAPRIWRAAKSPRRRANTSGTPRPDPTREDGR